jgi:hypothetical protein
MFWRAFRKNRSAEAASDRSAWWRDADAAADAVSRDAIDRLRATAAAPESVAEDGEREHEMLDGLDRLLAIADAAALPVVATQHRVIGTDTCHVVAPASLVDTTGASGKLFVTSARLIFAGGAVVATPWHRIRTVTRVHRDLVIAIAGAGEPLHVRCNSYGDALVALHVTRRLKP